MEGRMRPEGMTEQQLAEAQRIFEVAQQAAAAELWLMSCLMASKPDDQMLGRTEFQLRDRVLRIGAATLEAAVNERRKKGVTTAAASPARAASTTPSSSIGGPKRS